MILSQTGWLLFFIGVVTYITGMAIIIGARIDRNHREVMKAIATLEEAP